MAARINNASILERLLKAAGIQRVVFVDDRFGWTPERLEEMVNGLTIEQLRDSGAWPDIIFDPGDESIVRARIVKRIEDGVVDFQDVFDRLAAIEYDYNDAERDALAAKNLRAVLGPTELVLLSLWEWELRRGALLTEADQNPTLFIFDEDFTLEGQGVRHGRRLIGETHALNPKYKFVYALLTHNAGSDEAEVRLQDEIAEESPALADYVLVFGKNRLSHEGERFAERMKHLLMYRLYRALIKKLREETERASNLAIEKIDNIGIQSFEHIILGTSRSEGAWSPDTLVRVIGGYQQQQIRQSIRGDIEIHERVREIAPICDVMASGATDHVTSIAKTLQHDEIYAAGIAVNSVHLPLTSGDIFRSDKNELYVLLAQPCDLVVRESGLRRAKDRDSRQMVPLAPIRLVESKFGDGALPPEQYPLPHFDEKRFSARLSEPYYIPVWLLDMAVLNADGRCALTDEDAPSALLIDPWRKRLPLLKERCRSIRSALDKVTAAPLDRCELIQSYCRIPLGSPFQVTFESGQQQGGPAWSIAVGLTRVQRVLETRSTALLMNYAAYLARLAHPHDLTRI